jgi:hypothetical protein
LAKEMIRLLTIALLAGILSGCSAAYISGHAPFPRSSIVAEYSVDVLRAKVTEQEQERRYPAESNMVIFKYYPNPKEFQKLESLFQPGDRLLEFKNVDWWVGIDCGSTDAERAFCLMRADRILKSIKIWSADE